MPTNAEAKWWNDLWREGSTGWDLGAPHPALPILLEMAAAHGFTPRGAKVHLPGCGRAHEAVALAALGAEVVAEDFSPTAIAAASAASLRNAAVAAEGRVTLRCGDVTVVPESEVGTFAAVFDRAMLCALRPELREAHLRAVARRLRPGGLHLALLFCAIPVTPERPLGSGPPFNITLSEYTQMAAPNFTVLASRSALTIWPGPAGEPPVCAAPDAKIPVGQRRMAELLVVARNSPVPGGNR